MIIRAVFPIIGVHHTAWSTGQAFYLCLQSAGQGKSDIYSAWALLPDRCGVDYSDPMAVWDQHHDHRPHL